MTSVVLIGVFLQLVNFVSSGSMSSANQVARQQSRSTLTVVDFPPTPPTIDELVANVDLVVNATVVRSSGPRANKRATRQVVERLHELQVDRVLKAAAGVDVRGGLLRVRQAGGTMEVDGREISTEYFMRLLEPGDQVVLLLRRAKGLPDVYDVAYGADGAVWLDKSRGEAVLPQGLRKMPEFASRSTVTKTELLEALSRRR